MTDNLRPEPCLNCGKEPELSKGIHGLYCRCDCDPSSAGVMIIGPETSTKAKAIEAWNTLIYHMRSQSILAYALAEAERLEKFLHIEKQSCQNWDEVRNSPIGTRLVSDELEKSGPQFYAENSNHIWYMKGRHSFELDPAFQHNWRVYTGMTWEQLNEVAKVGDKATCGNFTKGSYIKYTTNASRPWKPSKNYALSLAWPYQTDWRIL